MFVSKKKYNQLKKDFDICLENNHYLLKKYNRIINISTAINVHISNYILQFKNEILDNQYKNVDKKAFLKATGNIENMIKNFKIEFLPNKE